jgi:hypothetical protein
MIKILAKLKLMKKIILSIFFYFLLIQSAITDNKFYFDLNLGESEIDTGVTNLVGSKLDEKDDSWSANIGYEVNENFSIEFGYIDFGGWSLTGNNGDTFDWKGDTYAFVVDNARLAASGDAYKIVIKESLVISEYLNFVGKAGVHFYDGKFKETGDGIATTNKTTDGEDYYYSLGLEGKFNNFYIGANFEKYELEDDIIYFKEVENLSFSFGYKNTF